MRPLPNFEDVKLAAGRLRGITRRTPVMTCRSLNERAGAQVFLKAECFQRTGSFKFRGASNAIRQLAPGEAARGVLTWSSGNHAQALALAGREAGVAVTVVMPEDAPAVKRAATGDFGATVVTYDRSRTRREDLGTALAAEHHLAIIPPYDMPEVIAGQGTCALELFEETGDLDVLFVCVGGGGLISGCALAARRLAPRCRVIGVEPEAGDDATRSFHTGKLQTVDNPDTVADGARTPSLGVYTFPLVMANVDEMLTVSDGELLAAMRLLWERGKMVVEPTGALAVAGLLKRGVPAGSRVGAIVSGGNVDVTRAAELLALAGGN